jgi:hypothetical protein
MASDNLKGAIDLGAQTIKSMILVNGVAAGALLTFYGDKGAQNVTVPALKIALVLFGSGVVAAVFCSLFAYLSQLATVQKENSSGGSSEEAVRIFAIALGIMSATLFLAGMVASAYAIK